MAKRKSYQVKESDLAPFKIGELVTTDFFRDQAETVRRVTSVCAHDYSSTGWVVAADGGEPCPSCHRISTPVHVIDSAWFKKVKA